jgi:metallo-beta-lactamase class B
LVYGDSQSAVSAPGFRFSGNTTYSGVLADFARSFEVLERLPCDIFLSPHPETSGLWERLARREAGTADALIDSTACRRYASTARERLAKRVAAEKSAP